MTEKPQYGQQVTFCVTETLMELQTQKASIEYVRTRMHGNMLLMNGEVQFSTLDEGRYHGMMTREYENIEPGHRVLILGGGDGLLARDVYIFGNDNIESITLVDYDQEFVQAFSMHYPVNEGSLVDNRTRLVFEDAVKFLSESNEKFDSILVDLPDPDGPEMQELYFNVFSLLFNVMKPSTFVVSHIGPVSLNPSHPNWAFISRLKRKVSYMFNCAPEFSYKFIPSFSHEWGFLTFKQNKIAQHNSSDIDFIYHNL